MESVGEGVVLLHITSGFAALTLFWVQILSAKGGRLHVWSGRAFLLAGGATALAALASILPAWGSAYSRGVRFETHPDDYQASAVLFFISIMVLVFLWSGQVFARYRSRPVSLPLTGQVIRVALAAAATTAMMFYALALRPEFWPGLLGIAAIGAHASWEQATYLRDRKADERRRVQGHISAMFGAGLAFHVAFLLVGIGRFVDIWSMSPAIPLTVLAVLVIGGIAIERVFRRRFTSQESLSPDEPVTHPPRPDRTAGQRL